MENTHGHDGAVENALGLIDLTSHAAGYFVLVIFVVGYYFIAAEEKYHINKAKPALFAGTFIFMFIGLYYSIAGLNPHLLEEEVEHVILEIAEIFFFLLAAMIYIETLIERDVFEALKYQLIKAGYTYKKLVWVTGYLAFFISPIADNLTTALILSTVLLTLDKKKMEFLVPGAINIVVAANAGGAWSPFGDITTLMAWTSGKGTFDEFFFLFPASFIGWWITCYLLVMSVPEGVPHVEGELKKVEVKTGGKVVIGLGVTTIFCAVMSHQALHIPAMWGMIFGLSLLMLFAHFSKVKHKEKHDWDVFENARKIEMDTLIFFFGILGAVAGLHFVGYLHKATELYHHVEPMVLNTLLGMISAVIDNVPVMSAVLKANPDFPHEEWMFVTLVVGIGGSLLSFGSAAGVGVMGKMKGVYTFNSHLTHAWKVLLGYAISIAVWYFQFEILHIYHFSHIADLFR